MEELIRPLTTEEISGGHLETVTDSGEMKNVVFILVGHYLPGFKGGGPTRSISNLVSALGKEFTFKVITLDRDLGAALPYPGVPAGRWIRIGNADVMYLTPGFRGLLRMVELLHSLDQSAVLYLNSFFSRRFSMLAIFLRRLGLIHPGSLVIAPRGEFSPGALQLKRGRKMLHIRLSRWLDLYRGVIWHASTQLEAANILEWFRGVGVIRIASVIPKSPECDEILTNPTLLTSHSLMQQPGTKSRTRPNKATGHLRVVFLSRISPKKNLLGALRMLQNVSGKVSFDIYGPLEDPEYWNSCKKVIGTLPPNILALYAGEVEHDRVFDVFAEYDLFLFPTLGENYGHVICESLGAGCPVLISDQTPWRDLQNAGVGWDIPVHDKERFSAILQQCVDADEEWFAPLRAKAEEYARKCVADPGVIDANRKLFQNAMDRNGEKFSLGR
jgi:glycosyltransferase involved in cell wall biosynthesis